MASFLDGGGISYLWKKITENFTPLSHTSAIANKYTAGHIYTLNKETNFNIGVPPSGFGSRGQGNANVQPCSDVADRYYAVEVDKSGYAFVNIPWTSGGLTGTVGSATTPVYLSNGTITACGDTLGVSISGNAATATASTTQDVSDSSTNVATTEFTHNYVSSLPLLRYKGDITPPVPAVTVVKEFSLGDTYRLKSDGAIEQVIDANGRNYGYAGDLIVCYDEGRINDLSYNPKFILIPSKSGGQYSIGSSTVPTYLNSMGRVTASDATVGSATKPMYLSAGTMTECDATLDVDITGNAKTADSANFASEAELATGALRVTNPLYLITTNDGETEENRLTYDGSSIGAMTIMPAINVGTRDATPGIYIISGNRSMGEGADYPISADVEIMLQPTGTDRIGGVKSFKKFSSGVTVPAISTTTTTPTIQTVSATSTRYYGLQTDSHGYGFVNVPWTDTKTTTGSSSRTGTKMYLIGATSQSSSGVTTYSNSNVYIGTDNKIYGDTLESYVTWDDSTRVTSPQGTVNPISAAMCNETKANRFAFINSNAITIEYSSNGGSTWTDYGAGANSTSVFTEGYVVHIGRSAGSSNAATTNCKTRVTICAQDGSNAYVYTRLKKLMICGYFANNVTCLVEAKKGASGSTWETIGTYDLGASAYGTRWPAGSDWNDIPLKMDFGGIAADTNNYWYLRLTFSISKVNSSSLNTYFTHIYGYGPSTYYHASIQSSKGPMSQTDHLYSYNASADASFPAAIYATGYNNSSDARLKENMCSIEGDIDKLNDVKLIEFSYKNDTNHTKHYGVTAQNLEEVGLGNLVSNIPPVNPEDEPYKGVDYISFLVLKIAQLEKRVGDLEKKLDDLQK